MNLGLAMCVDSPTRPDVVELLEQHLADMYATSPVLAQLVAHATERGYARVSLETGTQDFFAAARRLYTRHGFAQCPPFGDYTSDPNSVFMTRVLAVADGPQTEGAGADAVGIDKSVEHGVANGT